MDRFSSLKLDLATRMPPAGFGARSPMGGPVCKEAHAARAVAAITGNLCRNEQPLGLCLRLAPFARADNSRVFFALWRALEVRQSAATVYPKVT